jgi:hypothetical protein
LSIPSPDGAQAPLQVQGRIDRVDELGAGQRLVLDYKSSSYDTLQRKLHPDALCAPEFQLPLYAAALQQAHPGAQVDAAYVSVKSGRRTRQLRESLAKRRIDAEALLELDPSRRAQLRQRVPPPLNLADRVWEHVGRMRAGAFPVAPLSCERCELGPVCRIVAVPVEEDE